MKPTVLFTPLAVEDIQQIWMYIAFEADEETADRFISRIKEKCDRITRSPGGYRERPELFSELRSFPFGNYVIFYIPVETGIDVLRVLHSARDIPQILLFGPPTSSS